VLTDGTFNDIKPGMTEQEILRMIGPPGQTVPFPISNTHAWDYRFMDTFGYYAIFSVTFDANGIVVSKITNRLEGRDRRH
jgi:outer membrane protein assembly factor BamE (lipoprotein component of BamABCDE complex)